MRLADSQVDTGGAGVDLGVAGYQFPHLDPAQHPWDANWLVVTGSVRTASGASWSFRHPALTAGEAVKTVAWLQRVADGTVAAASGWLTFTEPNLSFAVGGYEGQHVRLLAGLSHESGPAPGDPNHPDWCQITVVMSRTQVQDAATVFAHELASYPVR